MDYLICATPRSGSNLLCSLLTGTGQAGHPREYLCPVQIKEYGPQVAGTRIVEGHPERYQRYIDGCRRAFSMGDRFGIKTHLNQLLRATEQGFDLEGNLPQRFLYLTRGDVLGQAISFVRASQTGAWISKQEEHHPPKFDAQVIREAIGGINEQNMLWEEFFRGLKLEPYRISYERLVGNFRGELRGALDYLDVDLEATDISACIKGSLGYFKPQKDELSAEWRDRYRAQVREWAASSPLQASLS